jgi:hypothetical protein
MFINATNPASPLLTRAILIDANRAGFQSFNNTIRVAPAAAPEPQTLVLFGSALGLFGITRRRFRR